MVAVPAGSFMMGDASGSGYSADGEAPVREVWLDSYQIDSCCVTNADFADFVESTGHRTDAERFGWSYVFKGLLHPDARGLVIDAEVPGAPWWRAVRETTWRCPTGPGSTFEDILDHPVVHISWNDARAYADWSGKQLPSEAQWEKAARGGQVSTDFPWGDELTPGGVFMANTWQGNFPSHNSADDGYLATAPVTAFEPNQFGLYNVVGNVWEWTGDWFSPTFHIDSSPATRHNPSGPTAGEARVVRGGSYLCHASYCRRYRLSARTHNTPDSSIGHTGFRCVRAQ